MLGFVAPSVLTADEVRAALADPSRSPSIPVGQEPDSRRCMTLGPEDIPASTVGVLYDGDDEHTDVAYCAECAAAMVDAGVFGSGFGGQHG